MSRETPDVIPNVEKSDSSEQGKEKSCDEAVSPVPPSYSEETVSPLPANYTNVPHSTAKSFGVRRAQLMAEAMDSFWLRILFYVSAFLCAYCYSLDLTVRSVFKTYATSSYANHSLYTTVNVITSVMAAASQPTYARLSDIFGRVELFVISIVFYSVGAIIESQSTNVQRFAAGAVFAQLGYSGVSLILQVSLADMSTLNWRLFASFIPALPFIINTWISGNVSSELLARHSWNYSIAIWAFIFPLACVPVLSCYLYMRIVAGRTEEWKRINEEEREVLNDWKGSFRNIFTAKSRGKSVGGEIRIFLSIATENSINLFWRLDIVGVLFIICVFGFILVPFTIAGGTQEKWQRASTIVPLVIGFVLVPFFVIWEAKVARFPIVPLPLLKDRGVWSAIIIAAFVDFIWYMPNDFMYTVLIVGMRASVKAATRITSLYSFVSVIAGPLLGLVIVRVKRSKPFIIFGCAIWMVSLGILLRYRGDNNGVDSQFYLNGVIGGLCLMGFGAGFFTYTTQVSIQACTNHEYMAMVLSLYLASYNIGAALGSAVSGAIWTQLMYKTIVKNMAKLGITDTSLAASAYDSPYEFIITNVWGTTARRAVVLSYAEIQKKLCIVGICLCVPLIVCALFLRDNRLEAVQSLDETHNPQEGVHGDKAAIADTVVVNNYDDDPIAKFFSRMFKRKSTN